MINRKRSILSALWVLAAVVAALGQQASPQTNSANRLRQAVEYLASDALEGRRTGTQGAIGAGHYIAGEFSMMGLRPGLQIAKPAATRGEMRARYLQLFPYVGTVELGANNSLSLGGESFSVKENWMPLGFSSNA